MKTQKLYLAMTRPPEIMGIDQFLFAMVITIPLMTFIISTKMIALLMGLPLFYLARYLNSKDSMLVSVFLKKMQKTPPIKNKIFWQGCNSYCPLKKDDE